MVKIKRSLFQLGLLLRRRQFQLEIVINQLKPKYMAVVITEINK